jgi:hypothetical protein
MKFLYFLSAANDAAQYPVDSLIDIRFASTTTLDMFFEGAKGMNSVDKVTLTLGATGKIDTVLESLAKGIANGRGPVVTIADDVNSQFIDANITSHVITQAS